MTTISADDERVAERVKEILVKKNPDGSYFYSKQEVRDFIVVAIFELKIPVEGRVRGALASFFSDLAVPAGSTQEDVMDDIRGYFAAHPLHPALVAEFAALGRSELLAKSGYENDIAKAAEVQMIVAAGVSEAEMRAPPVAAPPSLTTAKPKRGLAKK